VIELDWTDGAGGVLRLARADERDAPTAASG